MDLTDDDQIFLRDLVKTSRQRVHQVTWTDRDGSSRCTSLTAADHARLEALARQRRVGKSELLRQAAHLPVLRPQSPATVK